MIDRGLEAFEAIVEANFADPVKIGHIVPCPPDDPGYIWRAAMRGYPVRAKCGYVFVPTDPDWQGPMCPTCRGLG